MDLKQTCELMVSDDYKERFIAEYHQLKERAKRLKAFNRKIEAAKLTSDSLKVYPMPEHDCPDDLLLRQQMVMEEYLRILEVRALVEGVDLEIMDSVMCSPDSSPEDGNIITSVGGGDILPSVGGALCHSE